jgi:Mn2+/Fe2+ NRAMP family transporter
MGDFVNKRGVTALAWSVTAVIVGLNGWLLLTTFRGWMS